MNLKFYFSAILCLALVSCNNDDKTGIDSSDVTNSASANGKTNSSLPEIKFEEEVFANSLDDFFAKRPVEYTKHDKSITADDLF